MQAWWFRQGERGEGAFYGVFSFAASLACHLGALGLVVVVLPIVAAAIPLFRGCVDEPVVQKPPVEVAITKIAPVVEAPVVEEPVVEEIVEVIKVKKKRTLAKRLKRSKLPIARLATEKRCGCDKSDRCDSGCSCDDDCRAKILGVLSSTSDSGLAALLSSDNSASLGGVLDQIETTETPGRGGLGIRGVGLRGVSRAALKRIGERALKRCLTGGEHATYRVQRRGARVFVKGVGATHRACVKTVFEEAIEKDPSLEGDFTFTIRQTSH